MSFGLYEAAFATVAGLYGSAARNAITGISLFAGFASTIGWPAGALFMDGFGWRGACLVWAALHLVLGLPLNRLLVSKALAPVVETVAGEAQAAVSWTMIVLAGVFAASWFVSSVSRACTSGLSGAVWMFGGKSVLAAAVGTSNRFG